MLQKETGIQPSPDKISWESKTPNRSSQIDKQDPSRDLKNSSASVKNSKYKQYMGRGNQKKLSQEREKTPTQSKDYGKGSPPKVYEYGSSYQRKQTDQRQKSIRGAVQDERNSFRGRSTDIQKSLQQPKISQNKFITRAKPSEAKADARDYKQQYKQADNQFKYDHFKPDKREIKPDSYQANQSQIYNYPPSQSDAQIGNRRPRPHRTLNDNDEGTGVRLKSRSRQRDTLARMAKSRQGIPLGQQNYQPQFIQQFPQEQHQREWPNQTNLRFYSPPRFQNFSNFNRHNLFKPRDYGRYYPYERAGGMDRVVSRPMMLQGMRRSPMRGAQGRGVAMGVRSRLFSFDRF